MPETMSRRGRVWHRWLLPVWVAAAGTACGDAGEAPQDEAPRSAETEETAAAETPGERAGLSWVAVAAPGLSGPAGRRRPSPRRRRVRTVGVDVPVIRIWLTLPPAEVLRFEAPLVEPGDPTVRIDLLPRGESGPAEPVEPASREGSDDRGEWEATERDRKPGESSRVPRSAGEAHEIGA